MNGSPLIPPDPQKPPLLGLAPGRLCSRWLGDHNCGKLAVAHVLWDNEMENGFVCADHAKEVGPVWSFLQMHDLSPDCGMPNAEWFFDENVCRCEGEIAPAEVAETYERLGSERLSDLTPLCEACHESEHRSRTPRKDAGLVGSTNSRRPTHKPSRVSRR